MTQIPPTELIQAKTLPEAYGKAVNFVLKNGAVIGTQYQNRSKDACVTIEVKYPLMDPMLHPDFPTKDKHLQEYLKQWERGYDWKRFEYTYMNRLNSYPTTPNYEDSWLQKYYSHSQIDFMDRGLIDQLAKLKFDLSKGITSRRMQAITWIPDRDLFIKEDNPCLQRIWIRIIESPIYAEKTTKGIAELIKEGNVEVHTTWRSRDLYAAWNSNIIGLLTMVKRELLDPNHLRLVKYVDFCNSLHIYEADWEAASKVRQISPDPTLR